MTKLSYSCSFWDSDNDGMLLQEDRPTLPLRGDRLGIGGKVYRVEVEPDDYMGAYLIYLRFEPIQAKPPVLAKDRYLTEVRVNEDGSAEYYSVDVRTFSDR